MSETFIRAELKLLKDIQSHSSDEMIKDLQADLHSTDPSITKHRSTFVKLGQSAIQELAFSDFQLEDAKGGKILGHNQKGFISITKDDLEKAFKKTASPKTALPKLDLTGK